MSLVRKQLRKNLLFILKGRTDAKSCVFFNRSKLNWQENLPAINMYFRGEPEISEQSQAPREMKRILQLEVEVVADGNSDEQTSDQLDDLCEQIEDLLSLDDTIGNCASDITLSSISDIESVSEGSKTTMATKLTYRIEYYTYAPRANSIKLEDFKTVTGQWDIQPGQEEDDRANDTVTVQ